MIKVSVIIPVYNVEQYLGECLDSILGQTLREIEVLCVDDGSTDRSLEILESYAAKDARVRIFRGGHQGAYRARELALKEATGEFIHLMDSDDILDINAYEECYNLCEQEHLDHLIFTTESFVSDTDSPPPQLENLRRRFDVYYHLDQEICGKIMSGVELMGQMMRTGRFFVGPPLRFVRMAPLKTAAIPSPNAFYHGDNYYSAVWLYLAERAMAIDRKYYRRRVHGSSITTATGKEGVHFQSILNVIVALCRFEPFQKRAITADSQERTYLQELVGSMARRSAGVGIQFQCQALEEVSPPLPREMLAFMQACFLPMFTMIRDSFGGKYMFSHGPQGGTGVVLREKLDKALALAEKRKADNEALRERLDKVVAQANKRSAEKDAAFRRQLAKALSQSEKRKADNEALREKLDKALALAEKRKADNVALREQLAKALALSEKRKTNNAVLREQLIKALALAEKRKTNSAALRKQLAKAVMLSEKRKADNLKLRGKVANNKILLDGEKTDLV